MTALMKFPWLSWTLFVFVSISFGWLVASERFIWSQFIFDQLKLWGLYHDLVQERYLVTLSIRIAETLFVLFFTVLLSDSLTVLTLIFKKPFSSTVLTFIYILVWSFVCTIILTFLPYFIRFLILVASAMLLRLDLQQINFNHRQASILIGATGIVFFTLGIVAPKLHLISQ